jgi:hypothetical protein
MQIASIVLDHRFDHDAFNAFDRGSQIIIGGNELGGGIKGSRHDRAEALAHRLRGIRARYRPLQDATDEE